MTERRSREIDEGSEAVAEARRKVQELERKLGQHKNERRAEFDKLPETIKQEAECRRLEEEARALEAERREAAEALEAKYKAKYKAAIEEDEKALSAVREKQNHAQAEMQRLEGQFKALPEIANLEDESRRTVRLAEFRVNNAEYGRLDSARAEAEAEARKIEQRRGERHHAAVSNNPRLAKLDGRIRSCRARIVRPDPSAYVVRGTAELTRRIVEAKMVVDEAIKENAARHSPERSWLGNYSRSAFSGYYNYPYHRYIQKWARIQVGGGEEPQENLGSLEQVYNAQDPAKWHTKCDWECRLRWEQDGSIGDLPLVKKWLERARGK